MCLYRVDSQKTKECKKSKKTITAFKILRRIEIRGKVSYVPPFGTSSQYLFKKGENQDTKPSYMLECETCSDKYRKGFHSVILEYPEDGQHMANFIDHYFSKRNDKSGLRVIKVHIDPKDVIKVGPQYSAIVIVSKAITIKSFKNYLSFKNKK